MLLREDSIQEEIRDYLSDQKQLASMFSERLQRVKQLKVDERDSQEVVELDDLLHHLCRRPSLSDRTLSIWREPLRISAALERRRRSEAQELNELAKTPMGFHQLCSHLDGLSRSNEVDINLSERMEYLSVLDCPGPTHEGQRLIAQVKEHLDALKNSGLEEIEEMDLRLRRLERRYRLVEPGLVLFQLAKHFISNERIQQVLEPLVADWHKEHFEALDQRHGWSTFLAIRVRNTWAFLRALCSCVVG